LAEKIIELAAPHIALKIGQVDAISTAEWPTRAPRPLYSALDCTRLKVQFGINTQPWQHSLQDTIERILTGS
jgi:dTDP-4-dehydrorhamnose reductase